jgi:uncharacterized protein
MSGLEVRYAGGRTLLGVKVVPGSSRTAVAGVWNGKLKLKVAAPPEKGKANKALVEFIAKALGLRQKDVAIVSGETNPVKQVEIAALVDGSLLDALAAGSK